MRVVLLMLLACTAVPALAENVLTDRDRAFLAQQQRLREAQLQRARERCVEQRGVDCSSPQGLQEWMLLDRSREEAVLDQIRIPTAPESGAGSTTPAR